MAKYLTLGIIPLLLCMVFILALVKPDPRGDYPVVLLVMAVLGVPMQLFIWWCVTDRAR